MTCCFYRSVLFVAAASMLSVAAVGQALAGDGTPLSRAPIHRYSFGGTGGQGAPLTDSIGGLHGQIDRKSLPYHAGSTTVVVLPDTEGYAKSKSKTFVAMMEWVVDNKDRRNIDYLLHVGDVTNDNYKHEWKYAREVFAKIDGKIPYILSAGNHDYDHTPGRLTYMNDYFKVANQKKWPTFGGVYEEGKLENHYQFMNINGQKWIVLSLEFGPRNAVIDWANRVLAKHKNHLAVVLTHGYLYYDNARYDHTKGSQRATPHNFYGEGADGEMLWNRLVRKHPNAMMVICGHLSSQYVGYRKDKGDHGNVVHQMLVDYEKLRGGGHGFLRLLEFLPDGKTVQVRTYSPTRKEIRSSITKGDKPLRDPKLEEFVFALGAAPGQEHLLAASKAQPTTKPDRVDPDAPGTQTNAKPDDARLNGKGQLVIDTNDAYGFGKLSADLVKGRKRLSLEVWVTPTGTKYNWDPVVQFMGGKDAFYYSFRTLNKHRAELIVNGHNEDIQRNIAVKVGEPMHVVLAYDQKGRDGKPLLSSYVNGKLTGQMVTKIKLSELNLTRASVGPFAGIFDELRIYDYPLTASEVKGNFGRGPSVVQIKQ